MHKISENLILLYTDQPIIMEEKHLKEYFSGRLTVRVTLNGCGLPLDDARIYINDSPEELHPKKDGFTEEVPIFTSSEKGVRHNVDIRAECDGFITLLCKNVPIRSGYLTVWNMPLLKVKNNEKTRKQYDKST